MGTVDPARRGKGTVTDTTTAGKVWFASVARDLTMVLRRMWTFVWLSVRCHLEILTTVFFVVPVIRDKAIVTAATTAGLGWSAETTLEIILDIPPMSMFASTTIVPVRSHLVTTAFAGSAVPVRRVRVTAIRTPNVRRD